MLETNNKNISLATFLNNTQPNLYLTSDIQDNNSYSFLDLTLTMWNDYNTLKIYRKLTLTDNTIHAFYNNP